MKFQIFLTLSFFAEEDDDTESQDSLSDPRSGSGSSTCTKYNNYLKFRNQKSN